MVLALNFKEYRKGSMLGFLDVEFNGMTIRGVRLMTGKSGGRWLAFPQRETGKGKERQWHDIVEMTRAMAEHVRRLVIADLEAQGHLSVENKPAPRRTQPARQSKRPTRRSPEGEDMTEYYDPPDRHSDIPY